MSTWLWSSHRGSFEKAFEKNGRIDVDHHCKWLITAAVEKGTRPLLSRNLSSLANKSGDKNLAGNLAMANLVSRSLMEGLAFNTKMVSFFIIMADVYIIIHSCIFSPGCHSPKSRISDRPP